MNVDRVLYPNLARKLDVVEQWEIIKDFMLHQAAHGHQLGHFDHTLPAFVPELRSIHRQLCAYFEIDEQLLQLEYQSFNRKPKNESNF